MLAPVYALLASEHLVEIILLGDQIDPSRVRMASDAESRLDGAPTCEMRIIL